MDAGIVAFSLEKRQFHRPPYNSARAWHAPWGVVQSTKEHAVPRIILLEKWRVTTPVNAHWMSSLICMLAPRGREIPGCSAKRI